MDGLSKDGVIVEYKHVSEFNTDYIKRDLANYDGILLDLRLDDTPDSSDFTASEFAQHIRTLVTKGDLTKDLPIVLFSTDEKLQKVYSIDLSSHNLFDGYIPKVDTPNNASEELFALAKGYIEIEKYKNNLEKLIGLEDLYDLNGEIFARFLDESLTIPSHEYAQVILKDLIYVTSVLINEDILAARLGIDKKKSADWEKVTNIFESAKYKGVFSDGWDRWWEHKINNIFKQEFQISQSYLNADEKCQLFKDQGINNIISPKPIKFNSSNRFTTVCKVLNQPLDSLEGYRAYSSKPLRQWQEYDYVSLYAFAEKLNERKNIRVHPDDKDSLINAITDLNEK
ncbi:MAG: hypothetical protein QM487_11080 [Candidatus Marithrix sp.]